MQTAGHLDQPGFIGKIIAAFVFPGEHLQIDELAAAKTVQDVKPAAAKDAAGFIGRVGRLMKLVDDECRHHEPALKELGFHEIGDTAVDIATSPFRATVAEGANTGAAFDFDVPSKPAKKP